MERTDETVTVEGHRLHYIAAGDPSDPTVLLLHGGIVDAAHVTWGECLDPLAREFRVVALDMLGYGESDKPDTAYSLAHHVDVVAGVVDALPAESVGVAGISMGGGVALGLALRSPGAVDRLALVDSYGLGRELASGRLTYLLARLQVLNRLSLALLSRSRALTKASLAGIARDTDALSPEAVDAAWAETKRPGVGKAFRGFRAAEVTRKGYRTDYTDRLPDLAVPALFLHGEHDEVFPPAWSERAAELAPEADCRVLADCAHWAPRERPDRVVELLRGFFEGSANDR
ncbi:alpha/beta hydrolase [Halobacteriales archaeon QS_4_69_31]|nr:MAG: alpha/beta hydrolase [Halobacteriales archaeon QS_4_69_31]